MSLRFAAVLAVLMVLLGGGALLYMQHERSQQASNVDVLGQPLLKGLSAADVASIRIVGPEAALTLARKDDRWVVAEREGFPADYAKVRAFVLKAGELKIGQSEPIGEQDRVRLALAAPEEGGKGERRDQGAKSGTLVEFRSADAKPLASFIVGAKYFKQVPESPDRARADGRFVMLPDNPKTVYVVSDPLVQASAKSAAWIDTTGFAAERVKSIDYRAADGEHWKVARKDDGSDWKLEGARPGEKVDFTKPNSAAYLLGRLAIADVAPAGATPEATGLDQPSATIVAETLDGLTYSIRLGKHAGDDLYAKVAIHGTLVKTRAPAKNEKPDERAARDKEFAERIAKLEARLPREKALAEHTLLIAKSELDDLLKKRADLLEQKKK
jgi:hypothetical protein